MQEGWAFAQNVNLLAAGANRPSFGNTGTGIYAGRQGRLNAVMTEFAQSKLLVSRIKKVPGGNVVTSNQSTNQTTPSIPIWPDDSVRKYNYRPLLPGRIEAQHACVEDFCCSIVANVRDNGEQPDCVCWFCFNNLHSEFHMGFKPNFFLGALHLFLFILQWPSNV